MTGASPESHSSESNSAGANPAGAAFDRRTRLTIAAILAGTLVLVLGFAAGWIGAPRPAQAAPPTTSAEAGFARDMQVHHQQAVQMSVVLRDRSENEELRLLALDILTGQGQQAGQMYGWLALWGLPQAPAEPRMTWMTLPTLGGDDEHGHDGDGDGAGMEHVPGEPMPGLASEEDIARLSSSTGSELDRLYLELMIEHHLGGIDMAEAILDRSEHRTVTDLASSMANAQQSEIDYMRDLLTRV